MHTAENNNPQVPFFFVALPVGKHLYSPSFTLQTLKRKIIVVKKLSCTCSRKLNKHEHQ
jgi:hypothetical protein